MISNHLVYDSYSFTKLNKIAKTANLNTLCANCRHTYLIIHVTNTNEEINSLPLYSSSKCIYKINSY